MIHAKPVIANQYWILKKDDQKVGNIQAVNDGYQITIENKTGMYKTIPMLRKRENVEFEPAEKATKPATDNNYIGWYRSYWSICI